MGCDAGAADGGFDLLRIAWGVGMAAGAVLAEPGSAGLSTGEPRAVVVPTPEGGGGVVEPMRRSDGASGRHAGGAGRIAGGIGVAGAAVAMALVSRLLGAFAGSGPPSRTGRGNDPARGETVLAVRAAYALDHEGQGRPAGGAGGSPDGAGRSTSVHPELALAVAWRRCGRGRSAGGGMPGTVSGVARMQFRPGVPQPRQPTATDHGAGARRVVREGARHGGQPGAREGKASFVARHRRHPGVESAIHALESHGLDRVRTQGRAGFERTVGISILAANLHRLGRLLQQRAGAAVPSHARTTLSFGGLAVPILNIHLSRPSGRTPHAPKASRRTSSALLEPRWADDPSYIS